MSFRFSTASARLALGTFLALAPSAFAEECDHDHHAGEHQHQGHPAETTGSAHHPHLDLEEQDDGWFHFHPHASLGIALGGSTSEKNLGLIRGAHAPIDDGFNLQGLELGAVAEFGPALSLHAIHNIFWDRYDHWDSEWEEAFLALSLPGNLSLRGGQFFAPIGYENTLHLHDREFVEPPVSLIRLLGEEGLVVQGGDLAIHLPGPGEETILRFGYGQSRSHSHGGNREFRNDLYREALEHAGEEHHDDEDEDHEEEEHHHAHGFAGNGGVYDPDDAYLDDGWFFARLESDVCQGRGLNQVGVSVAAGENGFGRTTWIAAADLYGTFGFLDRDAWWRTEAFYRKVNAYDSAGLPGHFDEIGMYAAAGLEFAEDWTTAARLEWASGNRMSGNERRWRASANVGRVTHLADWADLHTKLQYSYDDLGGYDTEHSVWLQFVLNLGAADHGHQH